MPAVSNWMTACEGLVDADTPIAAMRAVVRYFHDHFEYAIDGPSRGPDLLTAFMEERRGHCTLFATAATLMLRARGIPARLVGGYVCRERHAMTGRWVARERDGHAWCEAWDERSGRWRRVEATPAGGLPGNFPPPGRLRLLGEAMAGYWRAFVKWIRAANPLVSLAEAGSWLYLRLESFLGTGLGRLLLLFLMLAVPAGLGWRRRYRKRGQDESARVRAELIGAMASVERSLTPPSLRRRPDEPWTLWMQRVSPQLPKDRAAYLNDLLTAYQNIRYQPVLDISRCHEWYHLRRGRP